jgi:putative oxidoreductase
MELGCDVRSGKARHGGADLPLIALRAVKPMPVFVVDSSGASGAPSEDTMNPDRVTAAYQPYLLSLFRFVTGLILFQFGVAKLFKFPPVPMFEAVTPFSLFGAAGMFELVLGGMLMLGLLTRPAAFILSGEMACAYFIEHFPKSFFPLLNGGTLAIMLCFACLYLAAAGAGPLSLDAKLHLRPSPQPDDRGFGHGIGQAQR